MSNVKKLLLRVPEVTLVFWIIKILSTTVGETGADFLSDTVGLGMPLVAAIMTVIMAIILWIQFAKTKEYLPANYWSVVVLMSIVGTLITDIMVDTLGVSLLTLSIIFTIAMVMGFVVWYLKEGTLSIHSIDTATREAFYWIIILLAFALGTGTGDLISEHFAIGYGFALLLFGGSIAIIAFAVFVLRMNRTLGFWLAFILTRPFGASLGDWLTQPMQAGGMGVNMVIVNLVFFTVIVGLVIYLTTQRKVAVPA